jgi:hypothetical protein
MAETESARIFLNSKERKNLIQGQAISLEKLLQPSKGKF